MPDLHDVEHALLLTRQFGGDLWPSFVPARIPLIVWNGEYSVLDQSGRVPEETNLEWRPGTGCWTLDSRHPALVSNTAVDLGAGLIAAAVLLDSLPSQITALELAALIVHEQFHVYQTSAATADLWPGRWVANELDVFGFPLTPTVLATRRLELRALRSALDAPGDWQGHAAEALSWRRKRREHLSAAQSELEAGLERLEGLAYAAELQVLKRRPELPGPDFAPEAVRQRCYSTGAALAQLLDRSGEWKEEFMNRTVGLEDLLADRLAGTERTELGSAPVEEAVRGAGADARAVEQQRQAELDAYLAQPGPSLRLESLHPIWPQGFDPLNISDVGNAQVLHRRFLRFGNAQTSGEILGRAVLTVGVGPHPLLNGFSAVTLTALKEARLNREPGALRFTAEGLTVDLKGDPEVIAHPEGWTIRPR